jgi:hypothetical protein
LRGFYIETRAAQSHPLFLWRRPASGRARPVRHAHRDDAFVIGMAG